MTRALIRKLRLLAAAEPDPAAAARAVSRARALLAPAPVIPTMPRRPLFWKLVMPTSLAALVALLITSWMLTTPRPASAAEQLRDVLRKQAAYDGWVTIESASPSPHGAQFSLQLQPAKRIYLQNDPGGFYYTNLSQRTVARYFGDLHAVYIGDLAPGWGASKGLLSLQHFFIRALSDQHVPFTLRRDAEPGVVHLLVTTGPGKVPSSFPYQMLFDIQPGTELLQSVSIRQSPRDPMTLRFRYRYDAPPGAARVEDLNLPPGTVVHDNRMPAEARKLLDRLDGLLKKDPGFDTAIVTRQTPRDNGPASPSDVQLLSRRGDRWLMMRWFLYKKQGSKAPPIPQGWPHPSLAQLLATVGDRLPDEYQVFDGKMLFEMWFNSKPRPRPATADAIADRREQNPILSQVWSGSRSLLTSASPELTTVEIAPIENYRRLRVTHRSFDPQKPGVIRIESVTTLVIDPASLMPINGFIELYHENGSHEVVQTTYDPTSVVSYRDSVLIPTRWRTVDIADLPGLPESCTLVPCPKAQLPDDWFTDPVQRLKRTASHRSH